MTGRMLVCIGGPKDGQRFCLLHGNGMLVIEQSEMDFASKGGSQLPPRRGRYLVDGDHLVWEGWQ